MGYEFEHGERVRDAAVRTMDEELDAAIADLTELIASDPPEAVHDCRKRCKKVRAAARLVRPALGEHYRTINSSARDAARELSDLRDATALANTLTNHSDMFDHRGAAFERARGRIEARRSAAERSLSPDLPAVRAARTRLEQLRGVVGSVRFEQQGWDAIEGGLRRTYGRGRHAMADAIDAQGSERFHEWRKRVKYTRHHLELLSPIAPELLDPIESAMHDLSDLLGDAHDLAVIREVVDDAAADPALAERQAELEGRAVALGRRLYAESPDAFTKRIASYWSLWD